MELNKNMNRSWAVLLETMLDAYAGAGKAPVITDRARLGWCCAQTCYAYTTKSVVRNQLGHSIFCSTFMDSHA